MVPFMLPREHFDLLVAVTFDGPRHEPGSHSSAWQRPSWLARPNASRDDIGWLLVRENVAALFRHYPLADWSEMPGAAPAWIRNRSAKIVYEFNEPGYQLSALEAINALETFETIVSDDPRYPTSHPGRFCASLHRALVRVLPGMHLAPSVWYRASLAAAVAVADEGAGAAAS